MHGHFSVVCGTLLRGTSSAWSFICLVFLVSCCCLFHMRLVSSFVLFCSSRLARLAHKVIKSSWLVLFTRSAFVLLSGSDFFALIKLDFSSTLFLVLVCLSRQVLRNCSAYLLQEREQSPGLSASRHQRSFLFESVKKRRIERVADFLQPHGLKTVNCVDAVAYF